MSAQRPLSRLLAKLEELGLRPICRNGSWAAYCPGHHDGRRRGLSIREAEDGKVLMHCHHGRSTEEILRALGFTWADLFPHEERRNSSGQQQRREAQKEDILTWWASRCGVPKEWLRKLPIEVRDEAVAFVWRELGVAKLRSPENKGWWTPEDGPRPPLWPALPEGAPPVLLLTEGESDCTVAAYIIEALGLQGKVFVAAATKGAAHKPEPALLRELVARGFKAILLVPDCDEAGEGWARAWVEKARKAGLLAQTFDLVEAGLVSPSLGEKDLRDAFLRHRTKAMAALKEAVEALADQAMASMSQPTNMPTVGRETQGEGSVSQPTNGYAVGRLMAPADLLASPTAESLESLPMLGQDGVIIKGWSHLLAAPPKCGKTELVWACVREWDAQGLKVLWVTEEGETIWAERLRRDRASPAHLRFLMAAGMRPQDIIEAIREAAPSFDVVIVDTLRHLFHVDEGDNAAIARTIASLDEAIGRDKTRLYLHHTRKAPGQHGERTAGGFAFVGGVDRQLELGWDEHDDNRRLLKGVSRIAPVPELLLAWEDGRLRVMGDPKAIQLAQVKERVLAVLTDTWQTTPEVMAALGEPKPSDEQVRKALRSLALEGCVEREPPITEGEKRARVYRWRLRSEPPAPEGGGGHLRGGVLSPNGQHTSWTKDEPEVEGDGAPLGGEDALSPNGQRTSWTKSPPAQEGAPSSRIPTWALAVLQELGMEYRVLGAPYSVPCPRCGADADVLPGGKRGHCPTCLKVFPISDEEEAPMLEEMPEEAPLTGAKPDPPVPSCRICNAPGDFVVEGEDAWVCASHSKT